MTDALTRTTTTFVPSDRGGFTEIATEQWVQVIPFSVSWGYSWGEWVLRPTPPTWGMKTDVTFLADGEAPYHFTVSGGGGHDGWQPGGIDLLLPMIADAPHFAERGQLSLFGGDD